VLSRPRHRLPAAERRSQLLEVALECFASRGFHETSMDDIADAAGVTKPVLYQHFPSKRDLYRQLLSSESERLLEEVVRRAGAQDNPYMRVLAGFEAYFSFVCGRTAAFQLVFGSGSRSGDDFAEVVREVEARFATAVASFIEADIDNDHRQLLGYAIVGLGEVAAREWLARGGRGGDGSGPDPAEGRLIARRLADLVWAGLRALPGGANRDRPQ
jgi:AcrR family transcriptional regulator